MRCTRRLPIGGKGARPTTRCSSTCAGARRSSWEGGSVAERKVSGLVRSGARVLVVALAATERLEAWAREGCIALERRAFRPSDLEGAFIVYAATDDAAVNEAVYAEAEARGVLANVVDDPAHCSFIVPSVVRRGSLQVAVSTGGAAPALAKRLRSELEERYPEDWEAYVELLAEVRALVRSRVSGGEADRARVLEAACDLDLLERRRAGERLDAEAVYAEAVAVAAARAEGAEGGDPR